MVMTTLRAGALCAVTIVAGGCKLSEDIPVRLADPIVVVHGVLNTAEARQFVRVERSRISGRSEGITGATVRMTHLNPAGCSAPSVTLQPASAADTDGLYQTPSFCPLRPGDEVALRVETPEGEVVTGTTLIPGIRNVSVQAGPAGAGGGPGMLELDRTRDTLRVELEREFSPAMEVEIGLSWGGVDQQLALRTDSTRITLPGNLIDPFEEDPIFRAGTYALVTVSAIDRNYFDFVRSSSDPFTGKGFLNHLVGGVGVFGSLTPFTYQMRVNAPRREPWEGVYRMAGDLGGVPVDITLDVYRVVLDDDPDNFAPFWARVDGTWIDGPIQTSANGALILDLFDVTIFGPPADPGASLSGRAFSIQGSPGQGSSFPVTVSYATPEGQGMNDTLVATRLSGP